MPRRLVDCRKKRNCFIAIPERFFWFKVAASALQGEKSRKREAHCLGWQLGACQKGASERIVETGDGFAIVQLPGGKKQYKITCFPRLSAEEEELLARVLDGFIAGENCAGGARGDIKKFFRAYCVSNLISLEKQQVKYLLDALQREVGGFGPLDCLFSDSGIEEIAVIGTGPEKPVFVFRVGHGWLPTNLHFNTANYVRDLANKMARGIGRRLSMQHPVLNANLADGSRLSAAIPPVVSFGEPSLTIRRFRQQPFSPAQLVENRTFSCGAMALLWIAMQCDCSLLLAGNTGSGKTSSLNALFSFVPESERIVAVEETPEIQLPHRHVVRLGVVKEQGITMQDLIVESLRMRPDRIVVGEVRSGEEVGAFIDTLLAGQGKGSYATFHSQSAREAISRMRSLGVMPLDLCAIDLVVVQRRWNRADCRSGAGQEVRRVTEIGELAEKNSGVALNMLFSFDYARDCLAPVNRSVAVKEKAMRAFSFGEAGWEKELERRERLLGEIGGRGNGFREFFEAVNRGGGF